MGRIYVLLLLVMMSWGFNVSALSVLVNNVDPIILTAARIFVAGVSVLLITYFIGIFRLPNKSEVKTIILISVFNVIIHHILLAIGLTMTSGVNTGIILGAGPIVTMLLSVIFLKNYVTRLRVIGFILGFIGIVFTSSFNGINEFSLSFGDVVIFLSMLVQAISFILISRLNPAFDPRLMTGYMLVLGSFAIFISSFIFNNEIKQLSYLISWKLGSVFLFSAIVATAIGHMIYNFAIKQIGPAESAIFMNLNTLFALIGSAIFLGEAILLNHYLGLILIVIGVFLGSGSLEYILERRRAKHLN